MGDNRDPARRFVVRGRIVYDLIDTRNGHACAKFEDLDLAVRQADDSNSPKHLEYLARQTVRLADGTVVLLDDYQEPDEACGGEACGRG